jgi:phenylpropionate dioxygenase-like ring-hydroxylating dioxygenase large terminal subunit
MNDMSGNKRHPASAERGGLPSWTYYSEELLELEKSELFQKTWQCAGHVSDIPDPGNYLTLNIVGERALIVRGKDERVRAFHNVCRHRGSRVVAEERGSCKSAIVCPFHGWSYNLDGTLRAVPMANTFPKLDAREYGLAPLDFDIWHGFIFVRFTLGDQPRVSEIMAPFEHEFAPYRLDEIRPLRPIASEILAANWKSVRDVDNEGYHVPIAHPGLQDLYGGRYSDAQMAFGVSRSEGILNEGGGKLWSVRHYKKLLPEARHLPKSLRRSWIYYGLFPNLVITLYPDSVGFYQEFPVAVGRTLQRFAYYALPDDRREMKLARYLSARIDRDTGREDGRLIVWSCEAMLSSGYTDVILSDFESGVRAYHDFLRRLLPVVSLPHAPVEGTLTKVNNSLKNTSNARGWS